MNYQIELTPAAEADLARLPRPLQIAIGEHLLDLAESPTRLSRNAVSPPYPPGFQMSQLWWDPDPESDDRHFFTVLFKFAADESRLIVHGIGYQSVPRDYPFGP